MNTDKSSGQGVKVATLNVTEDDSSDNMEVFDGVESDEEEEAMMVDGAADLDLADSEEEDDDSDPGDDGSSEHDGARLSPSDVPLIGGDPSKHVLSVATPSITASVADAGSNAIIFPQRPTPYTYDAGSLLVIDPNPLPVTTPSNRETILQTVARDATQSLLNHLLTQCQIRSSSSAQAVIMTLPAPTIIVPREKPVPQPKPPTKWELFAKKKGIGKNKQQGEGRAGKMVFDQDTGEWVPRYGYKGKNKDGENDWLVEIDEKKEDERRGARPANDNPRTANRTDRKARVKRNERMQRANERRARQPGA